MNTFTQAGPLALARRSLITDTGFTEHIYTATANGDATGYKNAWIWYCPTQVILKKKLRLWLSTRFHYAMNGLLQRSNKLEFLRRHRCYIH